MAWLLDTNVLVNAKRDYYGFEFCPGFWDWLDLAPPHASSSDMPSRPSRLNSAEIEDSDLFEPHRGQLPTEAAADDEHVYVLVQGGPGEPGLDIRIHVVAVEVPHDLLILVVRIRTQPLSPFGGVLLPQHLGVEP